MNFTILDAGDLTVLNTIKSKAIPVPGREGP
jgi:hypothetical protein